MSTNVKLLNYAKCPVSVPHFDKILKQQNVKY